MKFIKLLLLTILVTNAGQTYAALIVNGSAVNSLELSESFTDFYSYDTTVSGSSSTGLEQDETLVLFLAEYLGDLALFGLVDGTSETGDFTGGKLDVNITANTGVLGSLILADDPADIFFQSSSQLSFEFAFGAGMNDGFILSLNSLDFDITLDYLFSPKVTNAIFLDFASDGVNILDVSNQANIVGSSNLTQVPEPNMMLLVLGILLASSRRLKSM